MKNLYEVLNLKSIQKGIEYNLLGEKTTEAIENTISTGKNTTSIEINLKDKTVKFENTLHYDKEKKIYLLESRIFNKLDDSMINAYLEILDENLNIIGEIIDDVWEYADWKIIK